MIRVVLPLLMLCSAGCSDYPRDSADTSDRLRGGGTLRVGWVGSHAHSDKLRRLATTLSDKARFESGAAERLLAKLEQGELDLVLGDFDRKSPWDKRVTFSQPVAGKGEDVEARAATRNGEHRWAMTVDRTIAAQEEADP